MVSQKNIQTVKEVSAQLKKYPVIGIIDMFKLPASQLHQIRSKLRGKAVIRMVKKRLIVLALKESGIKGSDMLSESLQGEPALILTEMNPFKLAMMIDRNKSEAPAKEGDIAPRDIMVTAGPTSLPPGPVIGELQKAKIPASIEGDKIHVKQDTVIAKEGDEINSLLAGVMAKLGITPMEIGLNLLTAWEDGLLYDRDILFIPQQKYVDDLVSCHQSAFNLAYNSGYPTKETVPLLLSRAHQEAYSLAMAADILTSETVKPLLAKAHAQAASLKSKGVTAPDETKPSDEDKPEDAKPADAEGETKPEAPASEEAKQEGEGPA
ncbi:MAG: 50S ribosomal protein L10, partial [Candidatus Aenigmarchaeota archaeon]|nr:50S ribosomal protein L10 [Candidatus Aenigmarchaeota archaeon]